MAQGEVKYPVLHGLPCLVTCVTHDGLSDEGSRIVGGSMCISDAAL